MQRRNAWRWGIALGIVAFLALAVLAFRTGLYLTNRMLAGTPLSGAFGQARAGEVVLTLHVRDEDGNRVDDAEATARAHDEEFWNGQWVAGKRGTVRLAEPDVGFHPYPAGRIRPERWLVVVRARGFAPAILEADSAQQPDLDVTLTRGRALTLQFTAEDGAPLPDRFTPTIYAAGFERLGARSMFQHHLDADGAVASRASGTMTWAEPAGDGRYLARIPEDVRAVGIVVDEPGYLRGFDTGELAVPADPDEPLTVSLPQAGEVTWGIATPSNGDVPFDTFSYYLRRTVIRADGRKYRDMTGVATFDKPDHTVTARVPPGRYAVQVEAHTFGRKAGATQEPKRWSASQDIDVQPGATQRVRLTYTPFDRSVLAGDARALLRVANLDGQPAAGRAFRIEVQDRERGTIVVTSGAVNASGEINLEGLAPLAKESYNVVVDDRRLGHFNFKRDAAFVEQSFRMPPLPGDTAPALDATDLATGEAISLDALRGQVVYLDFWATWCGPCRGPVAKANELVRRRGAEWDGRVAVLAISIDDDGGTLRDTIAKRGLTSLRHAWADTGGRYGWRSAAAEAYGINSIPTAVLVDRNGRIAWRGHPGNEDVEGRIAALLADAP